MTTYFTEQGLILWVEFGFKGFPVDDGYIDYLNKIHFDSCKSLPFKQYAIDILSIKNNYWYISYIKNFVIDIKTCVIDNICREIVAIGKNYCKYFAKKKKGCYQLYCEILLTIS